MRKIVLIALFPAIACLWIVGWILYYSGRPQNEAEPTKTPKENKEDHLKIFTVLDQEQLTIKD